MSDETHREMQPSGGLSILPESPSLAQLTLQHLSLGCPLNVNAPSTNSEEVERVSPQALKMTYSPFHAVLLTHLCTADTSAR